MQEAFCATQQVGQLAENWPQLLYQDHFAEPFQRRLAFCARVLRRSAGEVALQAPAALVAPLSEVAARVRTRPCGHPRPCEAWHSLSTVDVTM